MDDETAEIELVWSYIWKVYVQYLKDIPAPTKSQQDTAVVEAHDNFDTRLNKLEKSILPLYTAAQILNRRRSNIDKTLAQIEDLATTHQDIAVDEALILRGPQSGQLHIYKDAVERLNTSIAFNSGDLDLEAAARLVETGAKKLTQLYTKVVAEGSSGTTPAPGSEFMMTSFPSSLLPTLSPVVSFLRTLPLPSTHPSHPAAAGILFTLQEAQKGYADMRGNWSVKCLEGQGKRLVARAESVDPLVTGREFRDWVELMVGTVEDEYKLLKELTPLSSTSMVASAYANLLVPILKLFSTVLTQLVTLVKKSLSKYNFLVLSAYEGLLALQPHWDDLLARRGPDWPDEKNEFKDGLQTLRGLCLRSFPEFLADVKLGVMSRAVDTATKVADFVHSTIRYIEGIPLVQGAVESALATLGDGNWKMGEGIQVGTKQDQADDSTILQHYVHDIVTTAINSAITVSRTQRRNPFGSIYLFNSVSYLRQRLVLEPRDATIFDYISPRTEEYLNSNYRMAKAGYFDANFSPLMQAITDDPKDRSNKAAAKEKFTRFFDLFDEMMERHRFVKFMEDDQKGKEAVGDEVIMLVVPSFQRFTQKQKDKEFSKNPQKYIKRTAEDVEAELRSLFQK